MHDGLSNTIETIDFPSLNRFEPACHVLRGGVVRERKS